MHDLQKEQTTTIHNNTVRTSFTHSHHAKRFKSVLTGMLFVAASLSLSVSHASNTSFTSTFNGNYTNMALSQLLQTAKQGDTSAQFFLASRYQSGQGVVKNLTTAFQWFLASAKQGAAPAQLNVGQMYATGKGVKKDLSKARQWLEKAARQGDNRASYNLALISERNKNLTDAVKWYELAARPEMLSDPIKQRAHGKIAKLSNKLSPEAIEQAKRQADSWLQKN